MMGCQAKVGGDSPVCVQRTGRQKGRWAGGLLGGTGFQPVHGQRTGKMPVPPEPEKSQATSQRRLACRQQVRGAGRTPSDLRGAAVLNPKVATGGRYVVYSWQRHGCPTPEPR